MKQPRSQGLSSMRDPAVAVVAVVAVGAVVAVVAVVAGNYYSEKIRDLICL